MNFHRKLRPPQVSPPERARAAAPPAASEHVSNMLMMHRGRLPEAAHGGGEPLPGSLRCAAEASLDTPLSSVRLHRDGQSAVLARDMGAKAATIGSHIFLDPQRAPLHTEAGRRTLGHELVHVAQSPAAGVGLSKRHDAAEAEAHRRAGDVFGGKAGGRPRAPRRAAIHRQEHTEGSPPIRISEAQLQAMSPLDVQRLIVAGGGHPGPCYVNPTYEQLQRDIDILRQILIRAGMYEPGLINPVTWADWERQENQVVLSADSRGMGYIGPRRIVRDQIRRANFGYKMEVGNNIRGGIFGAIGYGLGGDEGSYVGAGFDRIFFAAGRTAQARAANRAISSAPPPPQGFTQQPVRPTTTTTTRPPTPTTTTPPNPAAPAGGSPPVPSFATVRAYFNLPPSPTKSARAITGVLVSGREQMYLRSGEHGGPWGGTQRGGIPRGPGEGFTSGGPSQGNVATHVEGHAAAIMHQRGITQATLYVERDPCSICSRDLMQALPPGSTLTVISPGHGTTIFRSSQPAPHTSGQ